MVQDDAARPGSLRCEPVPESQGIYGADRHLFLNAHEVAEFQAVKHDQNVLEEGLLASC